MPCNQVVTNTVELEKIGNLDLLNLAIESEFGTQHGHAASHFRFAVDGYTVDIRGGRVTSAMPRDRLERVVGRVKQAYSREAVKFAAKRFGWAVEKGADPNNFHIRKG